MNNIIDDQIADIKRTTNGKRILFACVPADGHFNPLTAIAVHLKSIGYDVRWYTSREYAGKLKKLDIQHYPLVKALEVTAENVNELFPGRMKAKSMVAKLNFDLAHFFIERAPEYFEDIQAIHRVFPFDLMIADCAFTAIAFVEQKMKIPTIAVGIVPLMGTSRDLPPYGLGMVPSYTALGKLKQAALRWVAANILFKPSNKVLEKLCSTYGLSYEGQNVFDYNLDKTSLLLQSATPGFDYQRSDMDPKVHFAGPLLPYSAPATSKPWFDERLNKYQRVILVTQGTAEKDVSKLIKPTLEAFKYTDALVIVATGGSCTTELRAQYAKENVIIEDFIPFSEVMPYVDVYITNGGYGGTLLGIENELPMVVAGVHEGKSEICARVGYFKLGINLKTERPIPLQLRKAVDEIFRNPEYKNNVSRLAEEFRRYNANELAATKVKELIAASKPHLQQKSTQSVY
ncbi:glycosyltransferase [Segetibacter sp. 3557_3]|uniref:glycosyltransferase n=1 Tax=Segetibacter sp. 3557_3 TaxID=2547429 RepID=UPI0010591520|nr:nucleotide disphospho-sugar-binding domain-containing protein [Segetibacter sp. 3557_3]TDH19702.1 glycosyltransferase [Segetibacter sp. 3557_3]